jgi:hypothetical protein
MIIGINQSADAAISTDSNTIRKLVAALVVVSGDNIYVAWWTNNTANNNEEVMFRASNDGGATFSALLRLASNSSISPTEAAV